MTYSDAGLTLTKQFEGLKLSAYQDQVGVWTIGYGHTGNDVSAGLAITEDRATELLIADVSRTVEDVNASVYRQLTQNQFDALVDFTFNLGIGSLRMSHLLLFVNGGQFQQASNEFPKWNHAGGKVSDGLTRRRLAEQRLFDGA